MEQVSLALTWLIIFIASMFCCYMTDSWFAGALAVMFGFLIGPKIQRTIFKILVKDNT